ncbi:MAG: hypothetical protein ACFCUL_07475 [Flavobacteriaceae bacterium]
MIKLIYLFILTFGVISCSSDEETAINNSDLIGNWNWTSTGGGFSGDLNETPITTGKTYNLNLNANYTYFLLENQTEISSGTYELTMRESIYSQETERFISYSDSFEQPQSLVISGVIRAFENTNLSISDNNHDGIGSIFEKIE